MKDKVESGHEKLLTEVQKTYDIVRKQLNEAVKNYDNTDKKN